jgi:16S rRNA (guanine527-N7)-methyltransferase
MGPSRASFQAILERCGIRLNSRQIDALWAYHQLLRAANAELNLTRIHNFENMVLKHYVDSLLTLKFTDLPSPIVDMGSGPGLPGIPLKIARPELSMILAEPRGARATFLEDVVKRLGLEDVEVDARKVNPKYPRRVRAIITRAVAAIPETLDLVLHAIEPGGRMIFMKGPDCDAEIATAKRTHAESFRLVTDRPYDIPGTTHRRRIVIYERLQGEVSLDDPPEFTGPSRDVLSATNPTFKVMRDLLGGRGIRKHGQALLAGSRPIAEVLHRHADHVDAWVTNTKGEPPPQSSILWLRLADPLFAELDTAGTHAPLLLVRVPSIADWNADIAAPAGCTLFVPFQDPENVGAVIRSAAAFGVARVVLLREAAHPFHPRSSRAAGPALFQVPLFRGPSIGELHTANLPLITLSADGEDLAASPFPPSFGLVPGLEGPGLPEHLRGTLARRIPIAEGVESLNAATATAIALYQWKMSRNPD